MYSSLQLGVVEAQENPYGTIMSGKLFEVQKYLINTNHLHAIFHWAGSKEFFDGLSAEDRELVQTAIDEVVAWANQETRAAAAQVLQELQARGMEVIEVDGAAFRKLALPAIQELAKDWADGVYDEVKGFME